MTKKREITRADILPVELFVEERAKRRALLAEIKENRRVEVGPYASFSFENYDTMWWQVHEMLRIERGGEAQIKDELDSYNPLIPKGRELVATLMFEIEDRARRAEVLLRLGGVEGCVGLTVEGEAIEAVPANLVEHSTPEGRASAVHFLRFPFTDKQIAEFREPNAKVVLSVSHANYGHMAVLSRAVREALSEDFE